MFEDVGDTQDRGICSYSSSEDWSLFSCGPDGTDFGFTFAEVEPLLEELRAARHTLGPWRGGRVLGTQVVVSVDDDANIVLSGHGRTDPTVGHVRYTPEELDVVIRHIIQMRDLRLRKNAEWLARTAPQR